MLLLVAAQTAPASFHIMQIREVYSGTATNSSYVVLQMYSAAENQNQVTGHSVRIYNNSGTEIGTFTFSGPVASGSNQRTILVGDDGVAAAFGGETPDLTNANLNVPASGGAACFDAIDCVAWGNFVAGSPGGVGTPVSGGGITGGMAIRRTISGGNCANQLDGGDDTDNSAANFTEQTPNPRNNASAIEEGGSCTPPASGPTVTIGEKPASPTQVQSAKFSFTASPSATKFECKLDSEPAFSVCTSPKEYAGPLADGGRTFQVKGTNANGTGPVASHQWTIDTTDPDTTITEKPVDPSPGKTTSFRYTATEAGVTFECKLSPLEGAFTKCTANNLQPKVYSNLADGDYTFEVRAKDPAGNIDEAPASYEWEVDNSLADTDPPETTIKAKPSDPSSSTTAEFTYESDEAGSTFRCKMDSEAFSVCPAQGKTYTELAPGQHTFEVFAVDIFGNEDKSPAGHSFSIVLPATTPEVKPPEPPAPGAGPVAPATTITGKPKPKSKDRTPTIKFKSTISPATFECKLDGRALKPCRSPLTTKSLSFGRHTFKVAARAGGLKDPTPASVSFKIVKP